MSGGGPAPRRVPAGIRAMSPREVARLRRAQPGSREWDLWMMAYALMVLLDDLVACLDDAPVIVPMAHRVAADLAGRLPPPATRLPDDWLAILKVSIDSLHGDGPPAVHAARARLCRHLSDAAIALARRVDAPPARDSDLLLADVADVLAGVTPLLDAWKGRLPAAPRPTLLPPPAAPPTPPHDDRY